MKYICSFQLLAILCIDFFILLKSAIICPNACSGNGICGKGGNGVCACYEGYVGIDCSQRLCPTGHAWFDFPTADNTAHYAYTECSNMGVCDRSTGRCLCRNGYGGSACNRMLCPYADYQTCMNSYHGRVCGDQAICSGNGLCMSLRDASSHYLNAINDIIDTEYNDWDADMIYGCVCQDGYEGIMCDKKSCPRGDDPTTAGVAEVQLIECECRKDCNNGGFTLTINGKTTNLIPLNATKDVLSYRLQELNILEKFNITIHNTGRPGTLCSSTGGVTAIQFLIPHGPQPAMLTKVSRVPLHGGVTVNVIAGDYIESDFVAGVYAIKG